MKNIKVTYNANYNGCTVEVEGVDQDVIDLLVSDIVDKAGEECDEDGVHEGDDGELLEEITQLCVAVFGDDINIDFEYDIFSS